MVVVITVEVMMVAMAAEEISEGVMLMIDAGADEDMRS